MIQSIRNDRGAPILIDTDAPIIPIDPAVQARLEAHMMSTEREVCERIAAMRKRR